MSNDEYFYHQTDDGNQAIGVSPEGEGIRVGVNGSVTMLDRAAAISMYRWLGKYLAYPEAEQFHDNRRATVLDTDAIEVGSELGSNKLKLGYSPGLCADYAVIDGKEVRLRVSDLVAIQEWVEGSLHLPADQEPEESPEKDEPEFDIRTVPALFYVDTRGAQHRLDEGEPTVVDSRERVLLAALIDHAKRRSQPTTFVTINEGARL